ncbi:MAG: hypothetical protein ACK40X_13880, partial [Armatimonadota bacterium]
MEVTVSVQVPATTANLGSGFDAIGAALLWHSFVTIEPCDGLIVEVVGEGEKEIARDENNIAVKAVRAFLQQLPNDMAKPLSKGFRLRLDNRFPLTRGLGSSAAARVGALVAANSLLGEPLSIEQLLKIAVELEGHADNVAATLLGGVVVAVPTDEGISWARFLPPIELYIALLIPDILNPFFAEMMRGIQDEAMLLGYQPFLYDSNEDPQREQQLLHLLATQPLRGIILSGSRLGLAELSALCQQLRVPI